MTKRLMTLVALGSALWAGPSLGAQAGTDRPMVRQRIEQVFMARLRQDLALSPEQADRVGAVLTDWGTRRRDLEEQERALRRALDGQLRPGVAANADSLGRIVDAVLANRVAYAESFQGEMRDLAPILGPVQRAQFLRMRDQILQRVRELQEARPASGRPGRPGAP